MFIPGTNFNAAVSAPIAVALRQAGCQVVIPDVPGQPGLSSDVRVAGARRAAWYGAWLDELVEQVYDDRPVTVVGHSLGAAIALSASSPRISRRVLVSPGGLIRLSLTPAVLLHSTAWFLRPTPARSARLLTTMLAPGHQPPEQLADWMTLVARHTRTSGDPGRLHTTHSTPATTIAVSGSHDVFLPPERLRPAVRDRLHLDLRLVDDAGHLVVHENPAAIAALVA
nr:alpha/beta hydrolase [Kribbella sandramycini]